MDNLKKEFVSVLKNYSISEHFNDSELDELEQLLTRKTYKAGELIISENSSTNDMFFIEKGAVEILKTVHGKQHVFMALHEHEIFGELAFFGSQKRTSSVQAKRDVEVLVLKKEYF